MSNKTVTKKELVQEIADNGQFDPTLVGKIVQDFLDTVTDKLGSNHRLEFRDFGVFEVVVRKAKIGRNPRTKVEKTIPKHLAVKFKVGKIMAEKMDALTQAQPELLIDK